jgi:hypothetical protein
MDPTDPWNRSMLALTALAGLVGGYLTIARDHEPLLAVWAAGYVFLAWALARELDPDHQVPALVLAVLAGAWALLGYETALPPFIGILMATRLVVGTTGRRPLPTDLGGLALLATVISFTPLGWVMGFGLAVAIYVDDRMFGSPTRAALLASIGSAIGATVVATLSDAFPRSLPPASPALIAGLGLLALLTVVREPPTPVSFVDSRSKDFLRKDRLQAGRVLSALLLFLGALLSGEAAIEVLPMALVVAFALGASEIERARRPGRASR